MNLVCDHARAFRRQARFAALLYPIVIVVCISWGVLTNYTLEKNIILLQSQIQHLKKADDLFIPTKKEGLQTMQDVKNHLTHLFTVPLSGISFSVLSLDEVGMRVRGSARTSESLEAWLSEVSTVFLIENRASQQASEKGYVFEVLLHEKP